MDNTIKKGHTPKKKAEIWSDEEKQKLWYLYLDNSDLSCLDLAEKVKGSFHNRTENAITAMIYNLKQASEPSLIKANNLSESDVKKIVLEWYTNGMFADILQDEYGRDLEEILQEEPKTAEELLKTAMDIITDLEKFANKKIKNEIKRLFVDADIWIFKEGDI
jgi:hypothetical protein